MPHAVFFCGRNFREYIENFSVDQRYRERHTPYGGSEISFVGPIPPLEPYTARDLHPDRRSVMNSRVYTVSDTVSFVQLHCAHVRVSTTPYSACRLRV